MIEPVEMTSIEFSMDELMPFVLLGVGALVTLALLGFLLFMIMRERRKSK